MHAVFVQQSFWNIIIMCSDILLPEMQVMHIMEACYNGIMLLTFLIFSRLTRFSQSSTIFYIFRWFTNWVLRVLQILYLCFVNEWNSRNSFSFSLVGHFFIILCICMVKVTKSNILPCKSQICNIGSEFWDSNFVGSLEHLHGNLYGFVKILFVSCKHSKS